MKKIGRLLVDRVNYNHTITSKRGNLHVALRNLAETGVPRKDAIRFIKKYNTLAVLNELSFLTSSMNPEYGFREPADDYILISIRAEQNRRATATGKYPLEGGREQCWRYA